MNGESPSRGGRPAIAAGPVIRTALSVTALSATALMVAALSVLVATSSPADAAGVIDRLERACEQRRQFDLQARLHDRLHRWLLVHVPLSFALGVLLAVHVPVALWYW